MALQANKGGKQPYAIAMKDGSPFGLAGLWENWRDLGTGEWVRTFTIITSRAMSCSGYRGAELVVDVHRGRAVLCGDSLGER